MSETHETRSLAIIPKTLAECTDLAKQLAQSELLPKALRGKVPDVLMTIMAGQEMGLAPMAALRSFHVIEGKPVMSADGLVAVILGSGKAVYFERVAETDTSVTYETLRVGSQKPRQCTWTLAQAKSAALNTKDNWRLYPRAMLSARAKAELARDVYPDVVAGCYTEDEASDWTPPPRHADAIDAEIINETPAVEPPEIAEIDACETLDALKAHAEKLKTIPERWKSQATERYKARRIALTAKMAEPAA